jgi:hypothetical protein
VGLRERREEAMRSDGANQKGKHISVRSPMTYGPDGLAGWSGGLRGRGGLAWQTGPVGPDPRKNSNEVDFRISIEFGF